MLGPSLGAESRDLGVAPRGRQVLVEDAAGELRAGAECVAQHLERLAVSDEDQRLLVRPPPARRLRQQPVEPRIARGPSPPPAAAARSRPGRARPSAPRRTPARAGCDRAARRRLTASWRGAGARLRLDGRSAIRCRRERAMPPSRRQGPSRIGDAGRQAADVDAASRAGARRQRHAGREPRLDVHPLRKLVRPQQLQQPEEPVRIVLERRRAEQQDVAPERGNRRDGAVAPARPDARADAAAAGPRRPRADRCPRSPPARSVPAAATSVSSATTARR